MLAVRGRASVCVHAQVTGLPPSCLICECMDCTTWCTILRSNCFAYIYASTWHIGMGRETRPDYMHACQFSMPSKLVLAILLDASDVCALRMHVHVAFCPRQVWLHGCLLCFVYHTRDMPMHHKAQHAPTCTRCMCTSSNMAAAGMYHRACTTVQS